MDNITAIKIIEREKKRFLDDYIDFSGTGRAYDFAIEALKRQAPTPVVHTYMGNGIVLFTCPECKSMVLYTQRFCNMCGQRLKWDENN